MLAHTINQNIQIITKVLFTQNLLVTKIHAIEKHVLGTKN